VTVPVGGLATVLGVDAASAGVPASLLTSTIKTAGLLAAGETLSAVAGAPVAALTEGVLKAMFLAKLKVPTALSLAFLILAGGAGHLAYRATAEGPQTGAPKQTVPPVAQPAPAAPRPVTPVVQEMQLPPEVLGVPFRFSPDGKKVMYFADWAACRITGADPRDLAVLDLTTNTTTKITTKIAPKDYVEGPVWSHTGDHVAFSHFTDEGYSISVVSASGGPPRAIYSSPRLADIMFDLYDWSKDGKWMIAMSRSFSGTNRRLMLVPVGGGEPRELLALKAGERWLTARFSPDGQTVAYRREKDGQPGLFLFVPASQRELPIASETLKGDQPAWSPDGRYLLFQRQRGDARDLMAQRIKDQAPVGEPVVLKQDMPGDGRYLMDDHLGESWFQVLNDGRLVYRMPTSVSAHLYMTALDPETGQVRGKPSVFAPRIDFARPVLPPDGRWLAGSRNHALWVSKADGTEARKLPTEISNPQGVQWSSDGKSVLTEGLATTRWKRGLFRIDVATGQTETLTEGFFNDPHFSPDGQQVAFSLSGNLAVRKVGPNPLRPGLGMIPPRGLYPAWSSDGRSIAFIGGTPQPNRLLVIPSTGGQPKELVGPTGGWLSYPLWSPDGQFIVYGRVADTRPDAQPKLWLVRTAGGPPVQLRDLDSYLPHLDSCQWSTDGKMLLFKGQTERDKISVQSMTNYLPVD
jgi:Tol biopolymer transport system component